MKNYGHILLRMFLLAAFLVPFSVSAALAPPEIIISVPFTVQAPFGNWAEPWQNFCEEASAVMAAHFVSGTPLTRSGADAEMHDFKTYEQQTFGRSKDNPVQEVAAALSAFYGITSMEIKNIATTTDIKKEIRAGNVVVMPAAGKLLKNPYFRGQGPLYHMLVIKGFDDARKTFITNDPGTRHGESLSYKQERLFSAIHDWNEGDVMSGKKTVLVITR